jgi:hypothetical protein
MQVIPDEKRSPVFVRVDCRSGKFTIGGLEMKNWKLAAVGLVLFAGAAQQSRAQTTLAIYQRSDYRWRRNVPMAIGG